MMQSTPPQASPVALLASAMVVEPTRIAPGRLWRAFSVVGELLGAAGIIAAIPFAILAIGTPIVLGVRFLLWLAGML